MARATFDERWAAGLEGGMVLWNVLSGLHIGP